MINILKARAALKGCLIGFYITIQFLLYSGQCGQEYSILKQPIVVRKVPLKFGSPRDNTRSDLNVLLPVSLLIMEERIAENPGNQSNKVQIN